MHRRGGRWLLKDLCALRFEAVRAADYFSKFSCDLEDHILELVHHSCDRLLETSYILVECVYPLVAQGCLIGNADTQ